MSGKAFIQAKIYWAPLGYVQLTSIGSATGLTPPSDATIAEITVEAQGIRYRDDGTAPTATVGMPVAAGNSFQYAGDLTTVQFIAQTAGAILNISYYK
jgi:hypothetical protein